MAEVPKESAPLAPTVIPEPHPMDVWQGTLLPGDPERPRFVVGNPPGLREDGNIDLETRPQVVLPDGRMATMRSRSFRFDEDEVLLPTISPDGRIWTDEEAMENFRTTGQHLGKFDSSEAATAYAKRLSAQQQEFYGKKKNGN